MRDINTEGDPEWTEASSASSASSAGWSPRRTTKPKAQSTENQERAES